MSANIITLNDPTKNWFVYAANIASPTGNLYIGNSVVISGNTSLVGNVTTSNITGPANQSSLVRISGNLIIPSGLSTTGIEAGQLRYNTTLLALQFYNGTEWVRVAVVDLANTITTSNLVGTTQAISYVLSDGTTSSATPVNGGYTILKLTATANLTSGTITITPNVALTIDYLLVGGGGSGGSSNGGGGGGGGVISGILSLTPVNYNLTIGNGGSGAGSNGANNTKGNNGGSTIAFSLTAGGGGASACLNGDGNSGAGGSNGTATNGSGGGGAQNNQGNANGTIAGSGSGSGNSGGNGNTNSTSGGGGGAGGVGGQPNGGVGIASTLLGTTYYFGGGGGGCNSVGNGGNGGDGGGGGGSAVNSPQGTGGGLALNPGGIATNISGIRAGGNGGKDTGGGGGGAGSGNNGFGSATGSDGGSGIIVIRYLSFSV